MANYAAILISDDPDEDTHGNAAVSDCDFEEE